MRKNKIIFGLAFSLLLGFVLVAFFTSCSSGEQAEEKMEEAGEMEVISKDTLIPVLGEGEGSVSGLLDVEQNPDELKISYYFFIEDMANFDEEIERDLAPKIQKLYNSNPKLDRVAFTVYIPSLDETPYKPYVSFVINRELYEKTDWMNLLELEFFKVVMDVKYYE